ncbi:hypothetical protein B0H14DRAFT_3456017 [Mycena olivaceomarginata]|nr:hypothetical protein B0H14DRAFT_3456017 [Mycena olivaceomarginata]
MAFHTPAIRPLHTEKKKLGFRYIRAATILSTPSPSRIPGPLEYIPNNMLGPAPPPKDKDEPPKKPSVELVCFSTMECKQVLQPPGTCLCLMYGITCNPTVFGLACTHCNQKKFHTICDHTWKADRVCEFMGKDRGAARGDVP